MFTVSSLLENYSHCLESLRISDFAPLKLGVDCQYLAEPADPVSCDTSQASLLDNITPGIKFPPSARPDLSLCEKSLWSCVSPSRETFSKFASLLQPRVWLCLAMFGMAGRLWRDQTPGLNWVRDGAGPHLTRGCTCRPERQGENIIITQHHSPCQTRKFSDNF